MSNAGMMMRRIEDVGQHSGWFIALGVAYIVGGIVALVMPFLASVVATIVIGWVFIFVGIVTLVQAWQTSSWGGVAWQVIIGLLLLVGGISAIIDPISAALGLTLVIGVMFLAKGIAQIVMGFNMRPMQVWGWVVGAGVLALLVGLMIVLSWPVSGTWVIGTFAGISLIFTGWSYIMLAQAARRLTGAMA